MKTLEFTIEELELLQDVLQQVVRETDTELVHTDNRLFKENLKHRRSMLDRILSRLRMTPAEAAA